MTDMMYGAALGAGDIVEENTNDYYGTGYAGGNLNNTNQPRQRFPGLYVGNLTWWTTDRDVIEAINSIGVTDVQEVKFFENRNNGQSKGFCVVTFTSEASLPTVIEKLPTKELHGQNPVVTQYNRQNLNLFETQTKPRPQINSSNGPTPHAAGIMGINSISGVHAATNAQAAAVAAVAGMPYTAINAVATAGGYNQGPGGLNSLGGPRPPTFHPTMRMPMRGPRPMMRGTMAGSMNNGSMLSGGHQMNRMRFMQPPSWNNSQGSSYNPSASRIGPQVNMDMSNRLGGIKQGDDSGQDMLTNSGAQSYYTPHHPSSQSDHYRSDIRDHRDLRDERDSGSRRMDERSSRLDDRSLRHDDRSRDDRPRDDRQRDDRPRDDRSSKQDERSERSRREERPSRKEDDRSSRRGADDIRRERDDRTARREEKPSRHRERNHRSGERVRSRSRSRDRASREGKERRDRDRDRDRARERY